MESWGLLHGGAPAAVGGHGWGWQFGNVRSNLRELNVQGC